MALVVNLAEHLYEKLPAFKRFFFDFVFYKQNMVSLKELEQKPSLHEKVVGVYLEANRSTGLKEMHRLLEKLVNLKLIIIFGIGVDCLDMEWVKSHGIRIGISTQDGSTAANFGMALLLATARKIFQCVEYSVNSLNPSMFPPHLKAHDISANTIGIIGMGTIGYKLAIRAHVFEMEVLYHQRRQRSNEEEAEVGAQFYSNLMDMLPLCDYVMITCALTPQSYHLIGCKQLAAMKKTATLINIARGDIIDQSALVDALESGELARAVLDTTSPEPLPSGHKLYTLPNVIITPHCATNTFETMKELLQTAFNNMELGLRGEPMMAEVKLD